jgi:hypothetical protein
VFISILKQLLNVLTVLPCWNHRGEEGKNEHFINKLKSGTHLQ